MTDKPIILFGIPVPGFFSQIDGIGGHVAHVDGVLKAFNKSGYDIHVLAEEDHAVLNGLKKTIKPLKFHALLNRQLWQLGFVKDLKSLNMLLKNEFIYLRYSVGFSPMLPHIKRAIATKPLILEVNSFYSQQRKGLKMVESRALNSADLIICVSEIVKTLLANKFGSKLEHKTILIPNAVDLDRFSNCNFNAGFSQQRDIHLGYIGVLKPNYGLEILIEAIKELGEKNKNIFLNIYGDGPHRSLLEKKSQSCKNIIFHGSVPFFNVPQVIAKLDILINTASEKTSYFSPLKLYEYMAAKRPIIHARTKHSEMVLGNEKLGLLYNMNDPYELMNKITFLINNPGLAENLAKEAYMDVSSNHTWKHRIDYLLSQMRQKNFL